ncbi:inhibitor of growth proteins N-terminal histone-binding-domain-containing protein [Hyaloraphidium curvatum]|nr:inhibitor of growth proteins N-terminal histone-binding-domain-containing protein [Hyaloraphidium curvatum]
MALEFLEDFLATVDNLPSEIRHHFSELKEKDVMFQDLKKQILKEAQGLQKTPVNDSTLQREEDLASVIRKDFLQAKVLVDEKIDIADRTLALLESHIRRLDGELQRFQFDFDAPLVLQEDRDQPTYEMDELMSMFTSGAERLGSISRGTTSIDSTIAQPSAVAYDSLAFTLGASPNPSNKKRKAAPPAAAVKGPSNKKRRREDEYDDGYLDGFLKVEDDDLEEEPVYCICQRVSFGDMVGCDNAGQCPYGEWFHYECVGLREPPKGAWFCPQCRSAALYTNAGSYAGADNKKKRRH